MEFNNSNLNIQSFSLTIISLNTINSKSKSVENSLYTNLVLESNSINYVSKNKSPENCRCFSFPKNKAKKQIRKCTKINNYYQKYKIAHLVKQKRELKDLIYKDNLLDGYYNKNAFNRSINKAKSDIERSSYKGFKQQSFFNMLKIPEKVSMKITNFSLLLIDIDNFKLINDSLGHFIGDIVLKVIGNCISQSIKSFDKKFRWGGDEIALILYNVDEVQTEVIAERIRFNVENFCRQNVVNQVNKVYLNSTSKIETIMKNIDSMIFSVSIGGANYRHLEGLINSSSINILNYIFEVSDEKLYEAKHSGRNTVKIKTSSENKI